MARKKITVIGAGNVGASVAAYASVFELGDIVVVDILEGIPQGKGLDLYEATPLLGVNTRVTGANDFESSRDSDVIIITAGIARKPGMNRDNLLLTNVKIVAEIAEKTAKASPNAIMIVVSNPIEAMVYVAWQKSGFEPRRVVGVAGLVDSARFRAFLAEEIGVSVNSVAVLVLGGHGDCMVPLKRHCLVGGIPVTKFMSREKFDKIVERTRYGGAEIVGLLKTGSAFYTPAIATVKMAESIVRDQGTLTPCTAYLEGEYGETNVFAGVPAKLGARGVEQVIEVDLDEEERRQFASAVASTRDLVSQANRFL